MLGVLYTQQRKRAGVPVKGLLLPIYYEITELIFIVNGGEKATSVNGEDKVALLVWFPNHGKKNTVSVQ